MKWRERIIISFIFLCCMFAARGQISFSVKNEKLEKVFLLIEQQSNFHFIYSNELLVKAKPITLTVRDEKLSLILDKIFADQPLGFQIVDQNITIKSRELRRRLAGVVKEPGGKLISGVTIRVKGTSLATVSDGSGVFQFAEAPTSGTLLISGAEIDEIEWPFASTDFLTIVVSPRTPVLDETIVVAYGKTSRRYSTESVGKVKASEIGRQPVSNPLLTLAGRISGLQVTQASGVPGSAITVRIRGRNSMVNGNDPLYIVDGTPFPGVSLSDIFGGGGGIHNSPLDNLDPESIESIEVLKDASATAIYGSRGANGVILITTKRGPATQPQFKVKLWTGPGRVTRTLPLLNLNDYLMMRREAFANDGIAPTTGTAPDLLLWDTTRYRDWTKEFIGGTQWTTHGNASLSGGNQQTQFLAGTGWYRSSTVFPGDFGQDKYSGDLSLSHKSTDNKFSFQTSVNYVAGKVVLPKEDLVNYTRLAPVAPDAYTPEGKLNWTAGWANPYSRLLQTFSTRTETFTSSMQIGYKILPVLELRLSGGYSNLQQREHAINPLASQNPATTMIASANFGTKTIQTLLAEPQLQYLHERGRHYFDLLLGSSIQDSRQRSLHQTASGYSSDALLEGLGGATALQTMAESNIAYRYAALFGRLNYRWADKYILSGTIRRDGSSRFGPNNRFANFGSMGLAWIFTKEPAIGEFSILSFGKLRATAGLTGNDQIGDYKYLDLYGSYSYPYFGTPTYMPSQLYSPLYGWERVRKIDAGLDLGLIRDRYTLSVTYYHNTTDNQLVTYALPGTTGFNGILRNLPAKIRNSGWEIEGDLQIYQNRKWRVQAGFNVSFPRNKLLSFENFESSTYANTYVIGQPLSVVRAFKWLGVETGTGLHNFEDANNNGTISSPVDQVAMLNLDMKCYGGITSAVKYGTWELNMHWQFSVQPYARNYLYNFARPGTLTNQPLQVLDRWRHPGQVTSTQLYSQSATDPNIAYAYLQYSDAIYSVASFLRLRNLQFEYNWKNPRWNAKLFIQAQNLWTITKYEGLDPETQTLMPPLRTWAMGFNIQF